MAMEDDLVSRLAADTAIAALVAGGTAISWFGRVRGDGLPALVLSKISPGREWNHDGPDELDRPRVQFDAWAATASGAASLAAAVRAEMEQSADVGDTRFHPAMIDGEGWSDESEQDGGVQLFRISQDFEFYHEEI